MGEVFEYLSSLTCTIKPMTEVNKMMRSTWKSTGTCSDQNNNNTTTMTTTTTTTIKSRPGMLCMVMAMIKRRILLQLACLLACCCCCLLYDDDDDDNDDIDKDSSYCCWLDGTPRRFNPASRSLTMVGALAPSGQQNKMKMNVSVPMDAAGVTVPLIIIIII